MSKVEAIRSDALRVPHAFFGRRGGVSEGAMCGLNAGYGSGDNPALIAENRRRAIDAISRGAKLVTVHQVHSGDAVVAGEWPEADRPHADALVTNQPDVLIGILTADCAPVLLADAEAGVVGAAHAGWRGAFAGVTDAVISAMEGLGARRDRIVAVVGPCIAQESYEVDDAFRDNFLTADAANAQFFAAGRSGKPHFNLEAYAAARLTAAEIESVDTLHLDTYAAPDRFFSYRRATHLGEPSYGRQISMIGVRQDR
jgi:YfiH family protein